VEYIEKSESKKKNKIIDGIEEEGMEYIHT